MSVAVLLVHWANRFRRPHSPPRPPSSAAMAEAVAKGRALDATVDVVRAQHKKGHAIPDHGEEPPAGIRPDQLPLCDFTEGEAPVRHVVEIISEHVGE
eukprot:526195-Pyramimonas_sp.AAC.1